MRTSRIAQAVAVGLASLLVVSSPVAAVPEDDDAAYVYDETDLDGAPDVLIEEMPDDLQNTLPGEDEPAEVANPAGEHCDPKTRYTVKKKKSIHISPRKMRWKAGPGGIMSSTIKKKSTVTAGITGTGEFEAGAILAKAKTSISASIEMSNELEMSNTYTREISSKKKYGHINYGAWGYSTSWSKSRTYSNCTTKTVGKGPASLPTWQEGYRYYETNS